MTDIVQPKAPLPPLKIKCTSSNCENDQHCYLATRRMARTEAKGSCRSCGVRLVDWPRVHARNSADASYTFEMMKTEMIRHLFWHVEIDERASNYARRKGKRGMREAAERRLRSSVSAAQPVRDGQQTPFGGNPVFYAQHATATCCRRCIEEWHGIPRGRVLTDDEIAYLTELVSLYIEERFKTLTDGGEYVPPIRRTRMRSAVAADGTQAGRILERVEG